LKFFTKKHILRPSCPKTIFFAKAGGRDVLGVAYFGPEVPPEAGKGQNPAWVLDKLQNANNIVYKLQEVK